MEDSRTFFGRGICLLYFSLFGRASDAILLASWLAWKHWSAVLDFSGLANVDNIFRSVLVAGPLAVLGCIVLPSILSLTRSEGDLAAETHFLKPLLFPCETTHSRFFPEKHSFAYSYLLVGIPVGWSGSSGGMISADAKYKTSWMPWFTCKPPAGQAFYNINAEHYLARGDGSLGLRGKLDRYLESQVS